MTEPNVNSAQRLPADSHSSIIEAHAQGTRENKGLARPQDSPSPRGRRRVRAICLIDAPVEDVIECRRGSLMPYSDA